MLCNAGYPSYLLGTFVREKQALTLEHAIKRITSEPAQFFGLTDRGLLRLGMAAASLAVEHEGCQPAMPQRHLVDRRLAG